MVFLRYISWFVTAIVKRYRTAIRTKIVLDMVPAIGCLGYLLCWPGDSQVRALEDEAVCAEGSGESSAVEAVA